MKLYSLDNKFIGEDDFLTENFTGIVRHANNSRAWYANGKLHRLDGPAWEQLDGSKFWYINGKQHRLDGPAVEWPDGEKQWFVDGKQVTEEQCKLLHDIMKLKGLT